MDMIRDITTLDINLGHNPRPTIHRHEDQNEFFFCAGGKGTQILKDRTVKMNEGDFFLFPAGQPHNGNGPEDGICRGLVLNIGDPALLWCAENNLEFGLVFNKLKKNALKGSIRISLPDEVTAAIRKLLEDIIDENKVRRTGYQLIIRSCIEKLTVLLLRNCNSKTVPSRRKKASASERIAELCRLIESNFMYDINVEQAAKMTNFSRSHFHSVFAEGKGMSLVKHLNSVRIRKAMEMLRTSEMPFERIGSACGFKSLSHFYLVFRKGTGKKPSDFRK